MRSGYSIALRARKRVGSSSARLTPVRAGQGEDTCVAAPWTMVKAPSVPVVSPVTVACIVTEPTS